MSDIAALEGLRVLELGLLIAGPMAGRFLADFGAEVIKVETPGSGDPMRDWGMGRHNGHALWWPVQSRNKRLITLDLRESEGQELCRRLVERSDVLIENFRPGTMEGWGLGPDDLLRVNPKLIFARVSGYGQTGPYARRAGFAAVGEAMSGLRYVNGHPGETPPRFGVSLGDSLAAMFATQGILMALYAREATGRPGQVVDASILESCFAMLDSTVPDYDKLGLVRSPSGNRIGSAVPSNLYLCRDGRSLVIGANAESLFRRLCEVMSREDLLQDARYATPEARKKYADELDAEIAAWTATLDSTEVDRRLNESGVVCGPIYSIAEIFTDSHFRAREMLVKVEAEGIGELTMPGITPKLSKTPGRITEAGGWMLGRDNESVFEGMLGLEHAAVERLKARGIL